MSDAIAEVVAFERECYRLEAEVNRLIAELPGGLKAFERPEPKPTFDIRLAANAVPQEVIEQLRRLQVSGLEVRLPGRIEPRLFRLIDTVLSHLGGRWNKKAQAHVFTEDPTQGIARIIVEKRYTTLDRIGYFPTSAPLVSRVVDLAEIQPGHKALEPSAGDGRIADEIRRRFPLLELSVAELQPKLRKILQSKGHHLITEPDFMRYRTGILYDRIVMNPPFENQADIDHVLHAYDLLAPGGRVVSIMAESVTWRKNRKAAEFRAFLGPLPKLPGLHGHVEINPDGSFKEAGVNVKTVTVVLVKE